MGNNLGFVGLFLANLDKGGKRVAPAAAPHPKPLKHRRMYLDLGGYRGLATLESQLTVLGAVSMLMKYCGPRVEVSKVQI